MERPSPSLAVLVATLVAFAVAPAASVHGQAAADGIATVAGTGVAGFGGDGGPATAAQLSSPSDVAAQADGGYLVADTANHRIRRVSPAGVITTVAGAGLAPGFSGDALAAASADVRLNAPRGVAVQADGGFLVADTGNNRIRRVSPAGIITTVAGTGAAGLGGDGGPATSATLNAPGSVSALPNGAFLIADTGNHRIRRVDANGTIATVAGSGEVAGFGGDGGPATAARLNAPQRVVALAGGGFLIADTANNRIRRVDTAGTITTIAGAGTAGFAGDGGAATVALLNRPEGIAVRPDGSIAIADTGNQRVRAIGADGLIQTIAGTGAAGFGGDGGPATAAQLATARAVAESVGGRLLVADTANQRLRALTPAPAPPPPDPQAALPQPPAQAPPGVAPPRIGRSAVVAPVSGAVRVRLPGRRGFVPLTSAANIGLGAELDTTRGAVALFFTTTARGRGASAVASQGRFLLLQPNVRFRGERPGLLALSQRLRGCVARGRAIMAAASTRKRKVRVRAKGKIRTKGRYGSAIVLGTQWTIEDRCPARRPGSTRITVRQGVVQVRDFVRHRTVRVPRGRSYVARARR